MLVLVVVAYRRSAARSRRGLAAELDGSRVSTTTRRWRVRSSPARTRCWSTSRSPTGTPICATKCASRSAEPTMRPVALSRSERRARTTDARGRASSLRFSATRTASQLSWRSPALCGFAQCFAVAHTWPSDTSQEFTLCTRPTAGKWRRRARHELRLKCVPGHDSPVGISWRLPGTAD